MTSILAAIANPDVWRGVAIGLCSLSCKGRDREGLVKKFQKKFD